MRSSAPGRSPGRALQVVRRREREPAGDPAQLADRELLVVAVVGDRVGPVADAPGSRPPGRNGRRSSRPAPRVRRSSLPNRSRCASRIAPTIGSAGSTEKLSAIGTERSSIGAPVAPPDAVDQRLQLRADRGQVAWSRRGGGCRRARPGRAAGSGSRRTTNLPMNSDGLGSSAGRVGEAVAERRPAPRGGRRPTSTGSTVPGVDDGLVDGHARRARRRSPRTSGRDRAIGSSTPPPSSPVMTASPWIPRAIRAWSGSLPPLSCIPWSVTRTRPSPGRPWARSSADRRDHRRIGALHVRRPAADEQVAVPLRRRVLDVDRVEVAVPLDGRPVAGAELGDDARAARELAIEPDASRRRPTAPRPGARPSRPRARGDSRSAAGRGSGRRSVPDRSDGRPRAGRRGSTRRRHPSAPVAARGPLRPCPGRPASSGTSRTCSPGERRGRLRVARRGAHRRARCASRRRSSGSSGRSIPAGPAPGRSGPGRARRGSTRCAAAASARTTRRSGRGTGGRTPRSPRRRVALIAPRISSISASRRASSASPTHADGVPRSPGPR